MCHTPPWKGAHVSLRESPRAPVSCQLACAFYNGGHQQLRGSPCAIRQASEWPTAEGRAASGRQHMQSAQPAVQLRQ